MTTNTAAHPVTGELVEDIARRLNKARQDLAAADAAREDAKAREDAAEAELLECIPPGQAATAGAWTATTVIEHRGRRQINRQACEQYQDALLRAGAATCETKEVWTYCTVRDLDNPTVQAVIQAAGVNPADLVLKPTERYRIELIPVGSVDS